MPPTCSTCGAREVPDGPGRRVLVTVVDETGAAAICTMCVVALLAHLRSSTDLTVFASRPVATR